MKPWDGIVSEDEQAAYRAAGFGRKSGLGKHPALLIIDVQYRTVGTKPLPFWESIKEFPTSCGEVGWAAVAQITRLLQLFRANGWPVLYPHVAAKENFDTGRLAEKVPALMGIPRHGYAFVAEVAPRGADILLPKKHPSAFFGTPLASYLIDLGADTLVVTGCTTSGCVRGSVVDGFAYNFRTVVASDAVYDRSATSHAVNLFDMAEKICRRHDHGRVLGRAAHAGNRAHPGDIGRTGTSTCSLTTWSCAGVRQCCRAAA